MWQNDERKHELSTVFINLGNLPSEITEEQLSVLEYYLKRLYSTNNTKDMNNSLAKERVSCFERSADNDLRKLPMSRPALLQHTKRSSYQAGFLWMECVDNATIPDPTLWGWKRHEGKLVSMWQDLEPMNINSVIATCICKVKVCQNCKCSKMEIPCLPSCGCRRSCENK